MLFGHCKKSYITLKDEFSISDSISVQTEYLITHITWIFLCFYPLNIITIYNINFDALKKPQHNAAVILCLILNFHYRCLPTSPFACGWCLSPSLYPCQPTRMFYLLPPGPVWVPPRRAMWLVTISNGKERSTASSLSLSMLRTACCLREWENSIKLDLLDRRSTSNDVGNLTLTNAC